MRFKSKKRDGYQVFAVSGTNTISFAIDAADADKKGLLGFAVERIDEEENERYFMFNTKVFESVIPQPDEKTQVRSSDHPVQSFVWDDFTAKEGRLYEYLFYPVKGKPKNLLRGEPIRIRARTEPLFTKDRDDIFFNRGVASSQAYSRKFGNQRPDKLKPKAKQDEAWEWLSRKLDDALLKFIDGAKKGDTLLGCFYEFRYRPVAERFKAAVDRGVNVQLILDGKKNGNKTKNEPDFPRADNKKMVRDVKLPAKAIACWRENNRSSIQHNKFMVLLRGKTKTPAEVWTGSTNISESGIHGQTNVGHWVRDRRTATAFRDYWELLKDDPGAVHGVERTEANAQRKAYREAVMALGDVPATWDEFPEGISTVFSPRQGQEVLKMYVNALDTSERLGCITLAFGINQLFKDQIKDNKKTGPILFFMLEKEDKPRKGKEAEFVGLNASNNVYSAWGSYIRDAVYQWTRETNAFALKIGKNIAYIHSKFLLKDPLGPDPIVITGSANFSGPSTTENDENMLVIRGNRRTADIYFTEFNRLFFHYYFRSVQEATARQAEAGGAKNKKEPFSLFLDETDGWLAKYKEGTLRWKRVDAFVRMAGAETL